MPELETRLSRLAADLVDKIGWVVRLKGGTVAERLDPLIRKQIEAWFREVEPEVKTIQRAERRHQTAHVELGEAGA